MPSGLRQGGARPTDGGQNEAAAAMGRLMQAMNVLANKNIPGHMKADVWNKGVVPIWNAIGGDNPLPNLSAWPDALDDYAKKSAGILNDKGLGLQEKMQALSALQASANDDLQLAPMLQQMRGQRETNTMWETHRAMQALKGGQDGKPIPDEMVSEFNQIRERNPNAISEALRLILNRRRG